MDKTSEIIERMKQALECENNNQLTEKLGVRSSSTANWKSRGTIPYEACYKAYMLTGVSMEWLLDGEKAERKSLNKQGLRQLLGHSDYKKENNKGVQIPFYDVEASAGHGTLVINDQYEKLLRINSDFIRDEIGVNPNNVFLMLARGDSMYPTIKDGAMIMIEKDIDHLTDGIYVMRHETALIVKRLHLLPTGTIKVLSDNKVYEPYEIDRSVLEADSLTILGRVVWSGQRM